MKNSSTFYRWLPSLDLSGQAFSIWSNKSNLVITVHLIFDPRTIKFLLLDQISAWMKMEACWLSHCVYIRKTKFYIRYCKVDAACFLRAAGLSDHCMGYTDKFRYFTWKKNCPLEFLYHYVKWISVNSHNFFVIEYLSYN